MKRWSTISRPARSLIVFGIVLVSLAMSGLLTAQQSVTISSEEAIEIARPEIDFEPEQIAVRLVRKGFRLRGVWAVSFTIPGADGFERLSTVQLDANSGTVLEVINSN
ncbi:MAG TPA: hypothetical protein ENH15_06110 [Actinobacteria bacterium]|nr:hypothetical protein [Actinomycetota bacterium]